MLKAQFVASVHLIARFLRCGAVRAGGLRRKIIESCPDLPSKLPSLWFCKAQPAYKNQPSKLRRGNTHMASRKSGSRGRRYGKGASKSVASAMRRKKSGTLRSGKGGKGGKVKSRKQAIAIGLSEARKKGAKVPRKKAA